MIFANVAFVERLDENHVWRSACVAPGCRSIHSLARGLCVTRADIRLWCGERPGKDAIERDRHTTGNVPQFVNGRSGEGGSIQQIKVFPGVNVWVDVGLPKIYIDTSDYRPKLVDIYLFKASFHLQYYFFAISKIHIKKPQCKLPLYVPDSSNSKIQKSLLFIVN